MAKAAQQTNDPAALGALIPVSTDDGGEDGTVTVGGGDDTPPLLRHEPMPPPASMTPGNLQKARRVGAASSQAAAPVQPRKDIARMMPSSHRIMVYKKKEDGKQSFVNEYTAQELQGAGTIEAFIKKYVVPHYEHGEYHVHYFDGQSKDPTPLGSVTIEAPIDYVPPVRTNGHSRLPSSSESLREALAVQKELQQQMNQNQPPPKSQSEVMMETMMASMLKKQMDSLSSGDVQKGGGDGGMGMMLMMMMMERMKPAPAPNVDPAVQRIMEKLVDRLDAMEQDLRVSQSMMPPPPPPPSSDDGPSQLSLILETMRENTRMMVESLKSQHVARDPIKDLADLSVLMAPQKSDSLTLKDLFELMPKIQTAFVPQNQSKDPFEKTIENFRLFKMMQKEFGEDRAPGPPSQSDSFWTFAKEMLKSDVGKSIAQQIVAQSNSQEIVQHGQRRVSSQQNNAQAIADRRAQEAHQKRLLAEDRARKLTAEAERLKQAESRVAQVPAQAPMQATAPEQKPVESAQPAEPADSKQPPASEVRSIDPEPKEAATGMALAEAEPDSEEDEGNEVSVPEGFLNVHAQLINDAPTDAERIGAIISGFQVLATSADFRPVITKMFGLCKQNRKIESLDHLVEILEFFSDNEVLRPEIPKLARDDFDRHWNLIRQKLDFPDVPEVLPEPEA